MEFRLLEPHGQEPSEGASSRALIADKVAEKGLPNLARGGAGRSAAPVNVAQVAHLSPFRYPGGKTWLVPFLRARIKALPNRPAEFVEPFAGGAICAMTVAYEGLAGHVHISEIDAEVAAVWSVIFNATDGDVAGLCSLISSFQVDRERALAVIGSTPTGVVDKAFRTIVRNRVNSGGVLARGASVLKSGENGKGIGSRWYPETLVKRIRALRGIKERVSFAEEDAFDAIARYGDSRGTFFLIDPPYTAGGKNAGSRLYNHSAIDHARLFDAIERVSGDYVMTYEASDVVRGLARGHGMRIDPISMKNRHHKVMSEAVISRV